MTARMFRLSHSPVQFDNYTVPNFPQSGPGGLSNSSTNRQFDSKGWHSPVLSFLYGYTILLRSIKAKGLTLPKVVLDLSQTEHCLVLSYVAVSQVKSLDGLLFESSLILITQEMKYSCIPRPGLRLCIYNRSIIITFEHSEAWGLEGTP